MDYQLGQRGALKITSAKMSLYFASAAISQACKLSLRQDQASMIFWEDLVPVASSRTRRCAETVPMRSHKMKRIAVVFYFGVLCDSKFHYTVSAVQNKPLYENNFEKAVIGSVPDDLLVLDGGFAVQEEAGNKFLELPGAPLETFGVIFGPTEKENVAISARIYGTSKGRRSPTFAVGVGGQGGYRLQVAPSKKLIELYKGDVVKTSVPFEWQSGKWAQFKLQVRKVKDGDWKVEGKV